MFCEIGMFYLNIQLWDRHDIFDLYCEFSQPLLFLVFSLIFLFYEKGVLIGILMSVLGVDKKLMTWGWNEHGLCGNGSEDNVPIPHQVEALSKHVIKLIGCGAGHSFALTEKT